METRHCQEAPLKSLLCFPKEKKRVALFPRIFLVLSEGYLSRAFICMPFVLIVEEPKVGVLVPQAPSPLECTNGFACLSGVATTEKEEIDPQGLILHPAVVSLLVEYCGSSPHIISRLTRTCKTFSKAFPYSANMLRLGDWMAGLDFNSYNILEAHKAKKELSVQLLQTRHKPCTEGHSWEVTLMSSHAMGKIFLHCGVAHLHPRSMTLWISSEDGRSRGGLGVSLDIFSCIHTLGGLKACISSHIQLSRTPCVSRLVCSRLIRDFPSVRHQHCFCQNMGTLVQKLLPCWDDNPKTLQPFLCDRLTLAASPRVFVATTTGAPEPFPEDTLSPGAPSLQDETAPARHPLLPWDRHRSW